MELPIYQVDAFTDRLFAGNPAAVCPLPRWLKDETMQSIAAENNLAETAFFLAEGEGYRLRWFTPAVEVGWRLAAGHWGHGYATEAAREAVSYGFDEAGLDEIVSFTVPANVRSRRVMERLGMTRDPAEDFDHPVVPAGHSLRRHVLYRLRNEAWAAAR